MARIITEFDSTLQPQPKKNVVIDSSIQTSLRQMLASTTPGAVVFNQPGLDLVRWKMNKYWNDNAEFGEDGYNPQWDFYGWDRPVPDATNNLGSQTTKTIITVKNSTLAQYLGDDQPQGEIQSNWVYTLDKERLGDTSWQPKSNGVPFVSVFGGDESIEGKVFFDHVCEFEMPFDRKDILKREFGSLRMPYYNVEPKYNFFVDSYEQANLVRNSSLLPNMYAFLLVQQDQEDVILKDDPSSINNFFEKNVTLDGYVGDTLVATKQNGEAYTQMALNNRGSETIKKSSRGQYFDKWARAFKKYSEWASTATGSHRYTETAIKYKNLIAPMSDLNLYTDYNDKFNRFPMGVDINFSTDVNTKMAEALKESKLSSLFVKDVVGDLFPRPRPDSLIDLSDRHVVPTDADEIFVFVSQDDEQYFDNGSTLAVPASSIQLANNNNLSATGRITSFPIRTGPYFLGDKVQFNGHQAKILAVDNSIVAGHATEQEPTIQLLRNQGAYGVLRIFAYRKGTAIIFFEDNIQSYGTASVRAGRMDLWIQHSYQKRLEAIEQSNSLQKASFKVINPLLPPTVPNPQNLKVWDITSWATELTTDPLQVFRTRELTADHQAFQDTLNDTLFLGAYNEEVGAASENSSADLYKTLMSIIFSGKFARLVEEKTRTFKQILDSDKAYTEAMFYKIEKWEVDENGSDLYHLQNFYLPNSNNIDVHRYIDTQVQYDKPYRYKVFTYQAIFGNKYRYHLNEIGGEGQSTLRPQEAGICIFSAPSVKLVEVPYFTFTGRVLDRPPVWPDVEIIQYNQIKDKVLFFLRGNVGSYKMIPIVIEEQDIENINKMRESQNILSSHLPIEYKSDDQARVFEVFRTEQKPERYSDFRGKKIKQVQTDLFDNPAKAATAGAFIDDIEPNIKYYYTFRTIDNHGNTSNPTPIYEVEMLDTGLAPVLISNIVPLKKQKDPPQSLSKSAKRYIYIKLAPEQTEINESRSDLLDDLGNPVQTIPANILNDGPELGNAKETVWGNKYKIRLTSKKTGKKLDFKIRFKTNHIRPTNEGDVGG